MSGKTVRPPSPAAADVGATANAAPTASHATTKPTTPLRVIMIASSLPSFGVEQPAIKDRQSMPENTSVFLLHDSAIREQLQVSPNAILRLPTSRIQGGGLPEAAGHTPAQFH